MGACIFEQTGMRGLGGRGLHKDTIGLFLAVVPSVILKSDNL